MPERHRRRTPTRTAGRAQAEEGAQCLPHDQRGSGRTSYPAACAAVLGDQVPAGEAAEARRRPALLPAGRHRAAARGFPICCISRAIRSRACSGCCARAAAGCPTTSRPPPTSERAGAGRGGAAAAARPGAADPGLARPLRPAAPPADRPARPRPDPEAARLRALLQQTLRELEALRALLP